MPRRRPAAVRAALERPRHSSCIDGLPQATCRLLDRLDRHELRSEAVRRELARWHELSRAPRAVLQDVFDESGPGQPREGWLDEVRGTLQSAIGSLPRNHARHLAALVDRIDGRVVRRTRPAGGDRENPGFDEPPYEGWWRFRTAWEPEHSSPPPRGRAVSDPSPP